MAKKRAMLPGVVLVTALVVGAVAARGVAVRLLGLERSERGDAGGFEHLEGREYVNLTTFRKSGEEVTTPVWFALVDGRLYITTPPQSGKMKRIRNDPRVIVTPGTVWGALRGDGVAGHARDVEHENTERAERALHEKYRRGLALIRRVGPQEIGRPIMEVRPAEGANLRRGRAGRPGL